MKIIAPHANSLVLILSIAVIAATLAAVYSRSPPSLPTSKSEQQTPAQQDTSQEIKFKSVKLGSGKIQDEQDRIDFSFGLYKSSDGVGISVTSEDRVTSNNAQQELERKLKKAEEIIEQSPKFNENGEQVGTRAVLLFRFDEPYQDRAGIFWTDGQYLKYITAQSLEHVLKFEKSLYR